MRKLNVAGVSALLALAVVLGTVAATRSVALGTAQKRTSDATVHARAKRLDAFERSLQRALAQRTPALPRVPRAPSAAQLAASTPMSVAAVAPRPAPVKVVYRRPPPVIVTAHRVDGEHESAGPGEHAGENGDD